MPTTRGSPCRKALAGDDVVRNFFQGGRTVTVTTYSDASCDTPFAAGGQPNAAFEVEVEGVPPLWAAMPGMAWPELTSTGRANLLALSLAAGAEADFTASWTFPRGLLGLNGSTVCSDRARCGQDDIGRIGEGRVAAAATSATVHLRNGSTPLDANGSKMLALYGRTADGVDLQANAIILSSRHVGGPLSPRCVQMLIFWRTPSTSMSTPRPRWTTSPRSITRYWSASSAAKS